LTIRVPCPSAHTHCAPDSLHREDVLQVVDEVLALMKVPASSTAKAKAVAVERYRDTRSPEMSLAAFEKAMQASLAAIDGGLSDTEREEAMKAARFAFERERISAADTVFPKPFAARLVGRGLEEEGAAGDRAALRPVQASRGVRVPRHRASGGQCAQVCAHPGSDKGADGAGAWPELGSVRPNSAR
jgi:hypothetical protein